MKEKCINPTILFLALALILVYYVTAAPKILDIRTYGATPEADISKALSAAWKDAMESTNRSKIVIPAGKWMLSQAILQGPNLAHLELHNQGTIKANPDFNSMPDNRSDWININYVNSFTLSGGGVFDGRGQHAWTRNECNATYNCTKLPNNLNFHYMTNAIIHNVTSKDSKFFHINCLHCTNVTFTNLIVSAPGDSWNTDGIHVALSAMVNITDSVIGTGDDCISMGDHLTNVYVKNVSCGPGHGISIGSLGRKSGEKDVSGIHVEDCTFNKTTNGVRIKTWPSSQSTLTVSNLTFQDLVMINVSNPINIDQKYCPWNQCDPTNASLVQIAHVQIDRVMGSTSSSNAVQLICSEAKPCLDVRIGDIDLSYTEGSQGKMHTTCAHIEPIFYAIQKPPICSG